MQGSIGISCAFVIIGRHVDAQLQDTDNTQDTENTQATGDAQDTENTQDAEDKIQLQLQKLMM